MKADHTDTVDILLAAIENRTANVGIIGLGYVGLPLAAACARAGFQTIGFDVDASKAEQLNRADSYIDAVTKSQLAEIVNNGKFSATHDMSKLAESDVIIICVPTPLTKQREPDMSYVAQTAETISAWLRRGQTIVLESTTYPGTTSEFLTPILELSGLSAGTDFFVGFSPEREDPGNADFATVSIPKVVAGDGPEASKIVEKFYASVVENVVPVSGTATAEAVKITENIFRAVNIALVNELKTVFEPMGVDIWEVVEAAKTKPFGFMPFYPGPGLGGHCIPIDPYYLTWRAREFDVATRFIELAGEVNRSMPAYVVKRTEEALDQHLGKSLGKSKLLIVGMAYKKNVSDIRESPSFKIIELLEARGTVTDYFDPHVPQIPQTRDHPEYTGRTSIEWSPTALKKYDGIIIVTDHDAIDWNLIGDTDAVVVDTRNALVRHGVATDRIVRA